MHYLISYMHFHTHNIQTPWKQSSMAHSTIVVKEDIFSPSTCDLRRQANATNWYCDVMFQHAQIAQSWSSLVIHNFPVT